MAEQPAPSVLKSFRAAWTDLGNLGRSLLIGLGLVVAVVTVLAQTVPAQVERAIVSRELDGLAEVAQRLGQSGILPAGPDESAVADLDAFAQLNLLGHDAVRVKIWSVDGSIVYSDEPELIGEQFITDEGISGALSGRAVASRADATSAENRSEEGLPPIWEFYVPIPGADDGVQGVVEVYHLAAPFEESAASVWRYVTWSSVAGVAILMLLVLALMATQGRRAIMQQQRAETMFGNLVRARAEERSRIVGALHDDIGQRLYRIHFGLQAVLPRTSDGTAADIETVDNLVLEADTALRDELKSLRYGAPEELRLDTALYELVELTEAESSLVIDVDIDPACSGGGPGRIALFRVVREALINVRKHADATSAGVTVTQTPQRVVVTVTDDGVGGVADEGVGLSIARQRIEALGGGLKVGSRPGRGTRVKAWLPVDACRDDQ